MPGAIGKLFDPNIDDPDVVLSIRTQALAMLAEGKTIMQWQGEGTQATRQFTLPVALVLEATTQFLKEYDPTTYGNQLIRNKVFRA